MVKISEWVKALATACAVCLTAFGFTPSAGAAPPNPEDTQKLMKLLSNGYSPSNCVAAADLTADAIAVVNCTKNPIEGGPLGARYILYPDDATMSAHFAGVVGGADTFGCEEGDLSPSPWYHDSNSPLPAGLVSCGTFNGNPKVIWTNSANLLMASVQGTDVDATYQWWRANA